MKINILERDYLLAKAKNDLEDAKLDYALYKYQDRYVDETLGINKECKIKFFENLVKKLENENV